jgi:mannose/cellobiose epimerase-like protein (N-acyl-D-glucosamine 2-epimerase family)
MQVVHAGRAELVRLGQAYAETEIWLFENALPIWATRGLDLNNGGFIEKIDQAGRLMSDTPRRTRVVARQIFSFLAAERMGWRDMPSTLVRYGLDAFYDRCALPDGLVLSTYALDGRALCTKYDYYDHAFALFGLGQAETIVENRSKALRTAHRMMDAMARIISPK